MDTVAPSILGDWFGPSLPCPGVCWGTIGPCGLLGHCAIIPKESTYTRLQGVENLPQTMVIPKAKLLWLPSPLGQSQLAASTKLWTRKGAVSPPLSGSLFLAAYFYHHLLYSPRFHLAKGGNNIFLLQLHSLCFSANGLNQLKL